MTRIELVCTESGRFVSCNASGHAGFSRRGKDIVCAAETILLRTALEVLQQTPGVLLSTDMSARGTLAFSVAGIENNQSSSVDESLMEERLKCVGDFLRKGLQSLSSEYPTCIELREISE